MPAAAAGLAALALAACGGPPSSNATPSPTLVVPGGRALVFGVSVTLHGSATLQGTFQDTSTVTVPSTCEAFAKDGLAGFFPFPGPGNGGASVGGHRLVYAGSVAGFHGPGEYKDVTDVIGVTVDGTSYAPVQGASSVDIVVKADGSGTVAMSKLQNLTDSSKLLDGTISWSCSPAGPGG